MSLHVHRFGTGEQVHYFGIHGWGGGWRTFEPLAEHLRPDVTLWSIDLPGYGDSPALDDWWWEDLAHSIVTTARDLPVSPLHLVGNCSGAAFGLAAAKKSPGLFESLYLIDPFAYFPWYFRLLSANGVGRLFYATAFANPVGRWITRRSVSGRTAGVDATGSFESLDHDVVHAHLRMLRQLPPREEFAELDLAVTILYGEQTFDAVRASVKLWLELWPHADAVELRGAGHLPLQESPETVATQLPR